MPVFQNETSMSPIDVDESVIDLSMSPIRPRHERPSSNVIDIENRSASSNGIKHSTIQSNFKDDKSPPIVKEDKDEDVVVLEIETAAQRQQREIAASEELARRLMAEEAIESYRQSTSFLHASANEYSREDLAMIQAAMGYEANLDGQGDYDENENYSGDEEGEEPSSDMSYEALLRLGEEIGDVKAERWAQRAKIEIAKLPTVRFNNNSGTVDDNETKQKCLICQVQYESKEQLRHLPCDHMFHRECADQWLMAKDFCPYCRQRIH